MNAERTPVWRHVTGKKLSSMVRSTNRLYRNSGMPETAAFAERLSALCTSGPTFRNLDVVRADEL